MKVLMTLLMLFVIADKSLAGVATIDASLSNSHPVMGEQVSLVVDISVPGYFNGPTRFSLPTVDGVQLRQESQFAVNGSRRVDGKAWATQRWTILIYPHRTGVIALPSLSFSVAYVDSSDRSQRKSLSLPASLLLSYKPEGFPAQKIAVVNSLEIDEDWSLDDIDVESGQPIDVTAGQVLQRRIEIRASGTLAINIPALKVSALEGISLHTKEPQLRDSSNRGVQVATLVQNIDYVVEAEGHYTFGGEEYQWWSSELGETQQKVFPSIPIATEGSAKQRIVLLLIGSVFLFGLVGVLIWCMKKFKLNTKATEQFSSFNIKDYSH